MAERFGGRFSPGAEQNSTISDPPPFRGRRPARTYLRAKALFFVPIPLIASAFGFLRDGAGVDAFPKLLAFVLLILAAWLLGEGLKAEDAYNARKVARRPALPRKMMATALTGFGVFLAVWSFGGIPALFNGLAFGVVAAAAHAFSFGIDPLKNKGMEGFDQFEADRVARAIEKAEALLAETLDASRRFGDRQLEGRVERMAAKAREMFRSVENDPRDLTAARKYLTVYLMGARDATVKFADIFARKRDTETRAEYESLLADLETTFDSQREKLLLEDRSDLDVEIEVLRERLQREGVRPQ